ncbi:hypothetical protein [Sphingobium phenoxybenzoativorans]|uniref:hypothetical protein n=1 Tax=Sphingobium phenoxybenzoativorans TaxID=1592790 RepID=UPI001112D35B|nr:hypothetical protein [Sphingobium phenoxybenzoativorans]
MNDALRQRGHTLTLETIGQFDPLQADHDVFIMSKCNDAQAMLCAFALTNRGKRVGIDLFDDYFSQLSDSRFGRFVAWLSSLMGMVDFVLCSTPGMAEIARHCRASIPLHIMNDPADDLRLDQLDWILKRKSAYAKEAGELRIGWFGVGDNPHFRVGLTDLIAFSGALATINSLSFSVKLNILTNLRALTADGLTLLRQLPLPFELDEWSEDKEQAMLNESFACFLPVNAQNFSAAKSLNRAVSALTSGCQVISPGFPLYGRLDPLIYSDAQDFLSDLADFRMRCRPENLEVYSDRMMSLASKETEASALCEFLESLQSRYSNSKAKRAALLHGTSARGNIHKFAQRAGSLSIASPFCKDRLNFDARFRYVGVGHEVQLLVGESAVSALSAAMRVQLGPQKSVDGQTYRELPIASQRRTDLPVDHMPLPIQMARYQPTMINMIKQIETAFGEVRTFVSEMSPLPFDIISTEAFLEAREQ